MSQAATVLSASAFAAYLLAMLGYHADLVGAAISRDLKSRLIGASTRTLGIRLVAGGVVIHTVALLLTWLSNGSVPIASLFAWLLVVVLLILQRKTKVPLLGGVLLPIAAFALLYAFCPRGATTAAKGLRHDIVWVHLGLTLASYVCFALAFGMAVLYLISEHALKAHKPFSLLRLLPPLAVADRFTDRLVAVGLPLLTLGILMGVVLAQVREVPLFSTRDPKMLLAALTWLFFALYLITRHLAGWDSRKANLLILIGFASLLITFLARHTIAML